MTKPISKLLAAIGAGEVGVGTATSFHGIGFAGCGRCNCCLVIDVLLELPLEARIACY